MKNGYKGWVDSILKIKLKKELINQPSYDALGVNNLISKNVDVSLKDMVNYYEEKFHEINLEPCDFETTIYEKSTCKNSKKEKVFLEEVILEFRNTNVVNEIEKDNRKKIAIIYGANHFLGIRKKLVTLGFQ